MRIPRLIILIQSIQLIYKPNKTSWIRFVACSSWIVSLILVASPRSKFDGENVKRTNVGGGGCESPYALAKDLKSNVLATSKLRIIYKRYREVMLLSQGTYFV